MFIQLLFNNISNFSLSEWLINTWRLSLWLCKAYSSFSHLLYFIHIEGVGMATIYSYIYIHIETVCAATTATSSILNIMWNVCPRGLWNQWYLQPRSVPVIRTTCRSVPRPTRLTGAYARKLWPRTLLYLAVSTGVCASLLFTACECSE